MLERLLITAACSWYIAYAVTSTHGAFGMFERLREWRGGRWHGRSKYPLYVVTENQPAKPIMDGLLDCIICLIFWIALIMGYLEGLTILESIAAAGIGLWFHAFAGWRFSPPGS